MLIYFILCELVIQFVTREKIFNKFFIFLDKIWFRKTEFFYELHSCRKCIGFWVSLFFSINMNFQVIEFTQFPILENIITAIITTYLLYYLSEGITKNHQTIVVVANK